MPPIIFDLRTYPMRPRRCGPARTLAGLQCATGSPTLPPRRKAAARRRPEPSPRPSGPAAGEPSEVPRIFRVTLHATGIHGAASFYAALLGIAGRPAGPGRHVFECGPVVLVLKDSSVDGTGPLVVPKALCFMVKDLDGVRGRARDLGGLSAPPEIVEGASGERSFTIRDPLGNPLRFVQEGSAPGT